MSYGIYQLITGWKEGLGFIRGLLTQRPLMFSWTNEKIYISVHFE